VREGDIHLRENSRVRLLISFQDKDMGYFLPVRGGANGESFSVAHGEVIGGLSWVWRQDASANNTAQLICRDTLHRVTGKIRGL